MDGLHFVSSSLISYQQKKRRGSATERSYSVKSFTARSFSGSKFRHQYQNKELANKVSRWNALPGNSSRQTSFNSSYYSFMIPNGSNANTSSGTYIDISRLDKAIKINSKKKAKKKGKQNKKLSSDTGSTDLECIKGSLTSESGICKDTGYGSGQLSYGTSLPVSSLECCGNRDHSEGNDGGTINCSETTDSCTSCIDEGNVLEANYIRKNPLSNLENGVQTVFPEFSLLDGAADTHSKPLSCFNNPCSGAISEKNESCVLDSISVGSNGGETMICSYDAKLLNRESSGVGFIGPPYVAKMECFSHANMLNGVSDSCCHLAEETTSSVQVCTGGEMARRGKQTKRVYRSSSISSPSSVRSSYGRFGKECNHSVWQKVRKNDNDECDYGLAKANLDGSQSEVGLTEPPLIRKNGKAAQSSTLSTCEDKNQLKVKASRKLKRKTNPGSRLEFNCYSRKGTYATKSSSDAKINVRHNEVLDAPAQIGGQGGLNDVSRSCSNIGCSSIGFQRSRIESSASESIHSLEVHPIELGPPEHVCATLSSSNDQIANRESNLLPVIHDHCDRREQLEGRCMEYLHLPDGAEGTKIDKDVSHVEHSKQTHSSGSILQKWIPVRMKDSMPTRSGHSNILSMTIHDKPAVESCGSENRERALAPDPDTFASSVYASVMCTIQDSRDNSGFHSEDDGQNEKHRNQRIRIPKESHINHAATKCSSHDAKDKNNSSVQNDSNKIVQAVNDAYRAQLATEAIQMATGYPIAEFEQLLYSASPVISLSCNILSCQICMPHEIVGAPLCRHETPCVSLGSLWQWYEKHGTLGLEVRAEDYENPKRLGIDRFAFRAYFVPFLSAVQLFKKHKSHLTDPSDRIPGTDVVVSCKLDGRSENFSNIGCLPILPVPVSQPHTVDTSSLSPRECVRCSETSSLCSEGVTTIQLGDSTCSDNLELLFEYFEIEQPQQRRPLYDKIKELVRGDGPSQSRAYGDPTQLDSMTINDLHPTSWYSVAWYPIYRIPDGKFRAAFLTYHSLGHLVRRSAASDSFGVDACVVSPVVGLQSYNAQGECWFKPKQAALSGTTEEIPNSKPSGIILKERLRTLEQTAALMARAVVTKRNLTSVNRQPDYEFFLSRRRSRW